MTRLRKLMLEELERRNYSQATARCYLREVAEFAHYFHCPPDQLGPEHIRKYQAHLFRQKKLAPSSVTQHLAALRFFFVKALKKPWSAAETPYPKMGLRLPTVLSPEEVARLINSAPNSFYRTILMTLYGTGARCAEVARLKVLDIDSSRMVVHIQGGKGRKDRLWAAAHNAHSGPYSSAASTHPEPKTAFTFPRCANHTMAPQADFHQLGWAKGPWKLVWKTWSLKGGSARIPLFSTGGLAEQLGTREYCADRFFRRKLNRWLSEIKTLWPECPAAVSKDRHILVLNSSKKNPAVSCGKPSGSISLPTGQ